MLHPKDQHHIDRCVSRLRQGDEKAFNTIYQTYYRPLFFFVQKIVKDEQEAEDLVTESMLKLWERRDGLTTKEEIKSFLFTVAHHGALNVIRDRKRHAQKEADLSAASKEHFTERSFLDKLVLTEFITQLLEEVERLSPGQRDVFKLSYFEGLETDEIAQTLGITVASVYTNRKRALDTLKIRFKNVNPLFWLIILSAVNA